MDVALTNRIGENLISKYGSINTVIDYRSGRDIDVLVHTVHDNGNEFDHIILNTSYYRYLKGTIKSPYDISVGGIGYMGEGMYDSSDEICLRFYDMIICSKRREKMSIIYEPWKCLQNFADWYNNNTYYVPDDKLVLYRLNPYNYNMNPDNCILIPSLLASKIIGYFSVNKYSFTERYGKWYLILRRSREKDIVHKSVYKSKEELMSCFYSIRYKLFFDIINEYKDILPYDVFEKMIINIRL